MKDIDDTTQKETPSSNIDEAGDNNTGSEQAFFDITALMEDSSTDIPNTEKATVSDISSVKPSTTKSKGKTDKYQALDGSQVLTGPNGHTSTLSILHETMAVEQKHTIHCPFPGHEDRTASAFIEKKESGDVFIFCSSCQGKAWYPRKGIKKTSCTIQLPFNGGTSYDLCKPDGRPKSASTIMTELVCLFYLFHDAAKEAFARVEIDSIYVVLAMNSSEFEEFLSHIYFMVTNKGASTNAIKDAISTLSSMAKFKGKQEAVHIRVVKYDDTVFIDTCCSQRRIIKVDASGYAYSCDSDVKFLQKPGMTELAGIAPHGDITLLRKYVNISDDNLALLYGWLFCVAAGVKPFPILILQGEQGTGKSTISRVLRELIDPSSAPLRSPPSKEKDLVVSAINSYLVVFDNLSGLKPEIADCICRLSTGGAFGVRKLYSNGEQFLVDIQRPVIINGIADIATRADLAERSIIIELPVIEPSQRKSEKEYWAEFEQDKSIIYTGILNAIVSGLKHHDDIVITEKPRMADVVQWVTACERDSGIEGNFLEAYFENQATSKQDGIEASPVGAAIMTLMAARRTYSGTPTELLKKLEEITNQSLSVSREWRMTPKSLNTAIKRLMPSFRSIGINITQKKSGKRKYDIENTMYNGEALDDNSSGGGNDKPTWMK